MVDGEEGSLQTQNGSLLLQYRISYTQLLHILSGKLWASVIDSLMIEYIAH